MPRGSNPPLATLKVPKNQGFQHFFYFMVSNVVSKNKKIKRKEWLLNGVPFGKQVK